MMALLGWVCIVDTGSPHHLPTTPLVLSEPLSPPAKNNWDDLRSSFTYTVSKEHGPDSLGRAILEFGVWSPLF